MSDGAQWMLFIFFVALLAVFLLRRWIADIYRNTPARRPPTTDRNTDEKDDDVTL